MIANDNSRRPPTRYSTTAKLMHWSVAAAVIVLLPLGPVMKRFVPEGPTREQLYDFHEALGAVVLLVTLAAAEPPVTTLPTLWPAMGS